jgi:hypothetical protein
MILGQINKLKIDRITPPGAFLVDLQGREVLLPKKYLFPKEKFDIDEFVDVFVMKDSENRIVSTTETPYLMLNEIAFLKVVTVNQYGAFVDWGLDKDLFVPFREQINTMEVGKSYLIQLLFDEKTERLFGTERLTKSIVPCVERLEGLQIQGVIWKKTDLGYKVILNHQYEGLIFNDRLTRKIEIGQSYDFYISKVRADGKLDVQFESLGNEKFDASYEFLLQALKEKGILEVGDKSTPEEIRDVVGMSKKLFKQTIGKLYKKGLVELQPKKIVLKT